MCEFKPGDEVVCVDDGPQWGFEPCPLVKGATYVVRDVVATRSVDGSAYGVRVDVMSAHRLGAWAPSRFRKVERRNDSLSIEAFLTIKPGQYEEPRRKERVRA